MRPSSASGLPREGRARPQCPLTLPGAAAAPRTLARVLAAAVPAALIALLSAGPMASNVPASPEVTRSAASPAPPRPDQTALDDVSRQSPAAGGSLQPAAPAPAPAARIALVGGRVRTMAGRTFENGRLLIDGARIADVGGPEVDIPGGYTVVDTTGRWIVPGYIDAHTNIGLVEVDMEEESADTDDVADVVSPELSVLDAINPASELIPVTRINGITTVLVVPDESDLFSGQSALVDLAGDGVAAMTEKSPVALHLNLGESSRGRGRAKGRFSSRMGLMAQVRETFQKAKEYRKKWDKYERELKEWKESQGPAASQEGAHPTSAPATAGASGAGPAGSAAGGAGSSNAARGSAAAGASTAADAAAQAPTQAASPGAGAPSPAASPGAASGVAPGAAPAGGKGEKKEPPEEPDRDRKLEVIVSALKGDLPVMVRAHRADDIQRALDLAHEYGFRMILDHATEGYKLAAAIAAARVPVVVGPINTQPETWETLGARYENAAKLFAAGVTIAIESGDAHNVRNLPYQAGLAAAHGLPPEEALRAITAAPAKILGVGDTLGTLERGKIANVVVATGDPLQPRTVVERVYIRGRSIPLTSKQTELYDRFHKR